MLSYFFSLGRPLNKVEKVWRYRRPIILFIDKLISVISNLPVQSRVLQQTHDCGGKLLRRVGQQQVLAMGHVQPLSAFGGGHHGCAQGMGPGGPLGGFERCACGQAPGFALGLRLVTSGLAGGVQARVIAAGQHAGGEGAGQQVGVTHAATGA